jgi:acetyl esterase/lipase
MPFPDEPAQDEAADALRKQVRYRMRAGQDRCRGGGFPKVLRRRLIPKTMLNLNPARSKIFCLLLLACSLGGAAEPEAVYLWPNGAPGSEAKAGPETVRLTDEGERVVSNVQQPSLTVYLPAQQRATGAAVVIAPGGGHRELWTDHEGHNVAKWLAARGVAGFVLKYRLAREQGSSYTVEGDSLADTQRALRLVRHRAAEWGVNPEHIGVMGFSAGGELAALAATRFDAGSAAAPDAIDRESSRPAFEALIYPAIPGDMRLSAQTPPAFLACGEKDRQNISEGLPELYLALKKAGVAAELHVYAGIGHGFGLRERNRGAIAGWPDRFLEWLAAGGFLKP